MATPPAATSSFTEATLTAVGDIMMHRPQTVAGYNSTEKRYDFDHFFTKVAELLSAGDWVVGNLETPLAGAEVGYTGYPRFNAPAALARALRKAGFNILVTANNHTLDQGEAGVLKTLAHIRQEGLHPIGTAANPQEAAQVLIVEKHQIKMGILAYTYGTNGIPIPGQKDYLVALIDAQRISKDIAKARQMGADIVTVALHFGTEYRRTPDAKQKKWVLHCLQAGAD
ncbi:MAG: CapA family protein, partial [Bacteroidota bacterium]